MAYKCNPIPVHFKICRNSCVQNGYIRTTVCETQLYGVGNIWAANFLLALICSYFFRCQVWGIPGVPFFLLDLIFPHFWGARFGEYLVYQLFVGPHIPLCFRCQFGGVPGLLTFRWTSYSPIFEVHLIFPYFGGSRLGEYLVCQLFVGLNFPLFWGATFGEYLVGQIFIGTHIPLFLMCHIQGFRYCRFLSSIWLDFI